MPPLSLSVAAQTVPFRRPLRIAGYSFHESRVLVATLSDGQVSGRGEASGVYYRGENVPEMLAAIEAVRPAVEAGISREALRELMPAGGARNALDCALWDLQAKQQHRPVWQIAKLTAPRPLRTTFTLSAAAPTAMAQAARAAGQFLDIKLKLTGGDIGLDIARVYSVRAARPEARLSVDANQGYRVKSLPRLLSCLTRARVSLLEQPLPRGRESDLDGLRSPVPIVADESVQNLRDVPALIGRFDVANIKLDKCGGLTEGLRIVAAARSVGLLTMVGNMGGTSWATAPAYLMGQLCDFVDLDGPLLLAADRSPGVTYLNGHVSCDESVWGSAGTAAR